MMNLAHRGLGMTAPSPLCMPGGPGAYTGSPSLHQRSPFAIQELLGLNQHDSHRSTADHQAVISASAYGIPRTLASHGSPTGAGATCLADVTSPGAHFPSWRPNFIPFSTAGHHQNMLSLGAPQYSLNQQSPTDNSSGKTLSLVTFKVTKRRKFAISQTKWMKYLCRF